MRRITQRLAAWVLALYLVALLGSVAVAFALLGAQPARAQEAPPADPAAAQEPYIDEAPACAWWEQPATLRMGISTSPPGAWASWWCPTDAYSPWAHQLAVVRFDLLPPEQQAHMQAAVWSRNLPSLLSNRDRGVYQAGLVEVWAPSWPTMRAAMPPAPVWIVAKNGAATTRPAYPLVGGVRGKTSAARATVGATCDCAVRSVEGASSYCATNQERNQVAVCVPL